MKSALLRLEALLALMLAWVLVFVFPFRWTAGLFGGTGTPEATRPSTTVDPATLPRAEVMARRMRRVAAGLPWHSTCLVLAVAGKLLLARRGLAGGAIRLGVRKENGALAAHAWLVYGPVILTGAEGISDFQPVADVAAQPPSE